MKLLLSALLALVCSSVASAITVVTPTSGAQVASPFQVVASTTTCGGVPAVSMGYSIDSGSAVIEPTSFTAYVSAGVGSHTLHVKCWGKGTAYQVLIPITVGSGTPTGGSSTADIAVTQPASSATVSSPFIVAASSTTCGGVPTASMGYSIDSGSSVIEPTWFSATVSASSGSHTLHIKCWGKGTAEQVLIPITVSSSALQTAATPLFSLPSGTYIGNQSVSLSDATAGATIYYTTDGSGPTTASPRYSGPITISSSTVIEAMAVSSGYSNSGLGRASYVIKTTSAPSIPSNALKDEEIQLMPNWRTKYDPASGGSASGTMSIVSAPSLSGGQVAQYDTTYSSYGGVLYSVTYDNDTVASNFVYDAEVWIAAGSTIGNLEMDNNQVIADGDTVIYAFQCSGASNTWEYTENAGTPSSPSVKWVRSDQPCNPANWTKNAWHHVQIQTSRDDVGNVTYHSVWLDGIEYPINKTVMSAFSLKWASGALVANFQVDAPSTSGSSTLYLDDFTMYRW